MSKRVILVVGGAGALGSAILDAASANFSKTVSVDLKPSGSACHSIVITGSEELERVLEIVTENLVDRIDAVYCAAGSWQGGSIASDDLLSTSRNMWKVNVEPSIMAAQLALRLQAKLLVLTSAKAILHGTPDMVGYGMAKQAVVHLAKSLAADTKCPRTVCVLPEVIDTPANRAAMPGADTSRWTGLPVLAQYYWGLIDAADVPSGSLITAVTRDGQTAFNPVAM